MTYQDFLKKTFYFVDVEEEKYYKMNGPLKKKNPDQGFTAVFNQSSIKFFCFHLNGKVLCYYDKQPVSK
jgi:hypothetical protein